MRGPRWKRPSLIQTQIERVEASREKTIRVSVDMSRDILGRSLGGITTRTFAAPPPPHRCILDRLGSRARVGTGVGTPASEHSSPFGSSSRLEQSGVDADVSRCARM